jgi:serine/threonine-protein kinase
LPDSVPPVVADFVMRALEKDPGKRQPSAGDFGRTALAIAVQLREPAPDTTVVPAPGVAPPTVAATAGTGPTDTRVMTAPPIPPAKPDERQRRRVRNGFIATGAVVVLVGFLLLHSCTNSGVDTARVPKVVGDRYSSASHSLKILGFAVKRVGVHRASTPVGVVVGQSVKRGTELQVSSTVTLQVSTGPRTITINAADYLGRPGDEVTNELSAQHLKVQTLSLSSSAPTGSVIAIAPIGPVQEGATVTVTVASKPVPPGHAKEPKPPKPHGPHGHGH